MHNLFSNKSFLREKKADLLLLNQVDDTENIIRE